MLEPSDTQALADKSNTQLEWPRQTSNDHEVQTATTTTTTLPSANTNSSTSTSPEATTSFPPTLPLRGWNALV